MTFSPKINSIKEQRSFKKRGQNSKKEYRLRYGNVGLFFAQEGLMKTSYFRRVARIVKKKLKKRPRRPRGLRKRLWFFVSLNFPLTMKSTNSRMGKGKGNFVSWAIRVKLGQPLIEFRGFSILFIKGLKIFFFKKMKLRLELIYSNKYKTSYNISTLRFFTWNV